MKKCPCRFLVPVAYNDGRAVEPEYILEIKKLMDRSFGGCRISSASEGWWEGQVEGVLEFEVAVFRKDVAKLRMVVKQIGTDLGQKCMYFDAPRASVEIIDCDDDKEHSHE